MNKTFLNKKSYFHLNLERAIYTFDSPILFCHFAIPVIRYKYRMKPLRDVKSELDKRFRKVVDAPANFAFFVAIHDFIEYVEFDTALSRGLSRLKINREAEFSNKYIFLKQIYRGVEDIMTPTDADLGHERNTVLRDLTRIRNKETHDSNSFWKKRELWKKLSKEVHEKLSSHLFPVTTEV